ncbi:DUF6428 family protein [Flagellimonas sp.]|uniref:DUF6428 family protein n=1 Tax=Flagellimonas sp. TaxID=2058762 RepID=UPI003F4A3B5F
MNTQEFLNVLQENRHKSLLFEYQPGNLVKANYHITEVKNITVDSVDCGTGTDFWKETVVQLWESPSEIGKTEFMSASKALGILNKVDRIKPMVKDAELKLEYGNDGFHTAQLYVSGYSASDEALKFTLSVHRTDCKAKETCGVPETTEENNLKTTLTSCAPGSGCC